MIDIESPKCNVSPEPRRWREGSSPEGCRREPPHVRKASSFWAPWKFWVSGHWGYDRAFVLESLLPACAELACLWDTVTTHSIWVTRVSSGRKWIVVENITREWTPWDVPSKPGIWGRRNHNASTRLWHKGKGLWHFSKGTLMVWGMKNLL